MRKHYLENRKSLDDAGTETIGINLSDPITELLLHFRMKNGTTNNRGNTVAENVTGIEVIDGSEVLYSLDGAQAVGHTCKHYGFLPYMGLSEIPGHTQSMNVVIPFGRFAGDPVYGFDPRKFKNPQVRLTWDNGTVRAKGVDSFETGGVYVSLIANVMEDVGAFSRMLVMKEFKSWDSAVGSIEYTELPREQPYRLMLLRLEEPAYALSELASQVKLTCDAGKFIPWDARWVDFIREMMNRTKIYSYRHSWNAKNADIGYCILKQNEGVTLNPSQPIRIWYYNNYGKGEAALGGVRDAALQGITVAENLFANVIGWCPYRTMVHEFGDPQIPETWFPAPSYRSIRLELTGLGAAAECTVCLQQPISY